MTGEVGSSAGGQSSSVDERKEIAKVYWEALKAFLFEFLKDGECKAVLGNVGC